MKILITDKKGPQNKDIVGGYRLSSYPLTLAQNTTSATILNSRNFQMRKEYQD